MSRLTHLRDDMRTCLAFFSRIRVGSPAGTVSLCDAAGAWPASGLVIALIPALVFAITTMAGIPGLASAALALASGAIATGGLHEDGFSDMADGFGGGQDRQSKLAIMADSQIGVFGALALVFSTVIRIAALATFAATPLLGAAAIFGIAASSRALALWHWADLPPAKPDGLARTVGQPSASSLRFGVLCGAVALVVIIILFGGAGLFAGITAALCIVAFNRLCRHQIDGHTGDTIGAAQLIGEIILYAGLSASISATTLT